MNTKALKLNKILKINALNIRSNNYPKILLTDNILTIKDDKSNFIIEIELIPFDRKKSNPMSINNTIKEFHEINDLPNDFIFNTNNRVATFFRALLAYILHKVFMYGKTQIARLLTSNMKTPTKICHATIIYYIKLIETFYETKEKPYYDICIRSINFFEIKNETNGKTVVV